MGDGFPGTLENASELATKMRTALEQGADLESVILEFSGQGGEVLESALQHDPRNLKFEGFWRWASGAEVGRIIGPMWIQGWERQRHDAQGQVVREVVPNSFLTAVITGTTPETTKTFEEAREEVTTPLLYLKMMNRLREGYGIETFPDNLPDPAMYDQGATRTIFDTAPKN